MQDEIKKKCASDGLSFNLSAKFLRKVAIAHMRAQGVSEGDRCHRIHCDEQCLRLRNGFRTSVCALRKA